MCKKEGKEERGVRKVWKASVGGEKEGVDGGVCTGVYEVVVTFGLCRLWICVCINFVTYVLQIFLLISSVSSFMLTIPAFFYVTANLGICLQCQIAQLIP